MRRGSILLVAPLFSPAEPGGLQLATIDLAGELERRGWSLTVATSQRSHPAPLIAGETLPLLSAPPHLAGAWTGVLDRLYAVLASTWSPDTVHRLARAAPLTRQLRRLARTLSNDLTALEHLLFTRTFDVVIVADYPLMPGVTALVADRHPRAIVLSLTSFVRELSQRRWGTMARLGRLLAGAASHPYLFRPVNSTGLAGVVCPSAAWRDHAIEAGIAPGVARAIYFGIAWTPTPPVASPPSAALLFVGRLAPDKGLHRILPGFARCRAERPELTLTVIAGPGPSWYRAHCERLARRLGIEEAILWRTAVPREALPDICRSHGALLFYSGNEEPVALTLLHAMSAGLPIVASHPARPGPMLQKNKTCVCYDPGDPNSLARTIEHVLDDHDLRARLVCTAYREASRSCSLDEMGSAWDHFLQGLIHETADSWRWDVRGGSARDDRVAW